MSDYPSQGQGPRDLQGRPQAQAGAGLRLSGAQRQPCVALDVKADWKRQEERQTTRPLGRLRNRKAREFAYAPYRWR